ncbi:hypothetical protein [Tolypothrix sp. NIES-4075]|uniref:hypothetical protein n=1 Tax=Tolypothrix sp. NIES-4075 TaxID=2005459 RepID=UPI001F462D0C|nr:hypothetical protein [Tolypothrix sp. NIES-4075]
MIVKKARSLLINVLPFVREINHALPKTLCRDAIYRVFGSDIEEFRFGVVDDIKNESCPNQLRNC